MIVCYMLYSRCTLPRPVSKADNNRTTFYDRKSIVKFVDVNVDRRRRVAMRTYINFVDQCLKASLPDIIAVYFCCILMNLVATFISNIRLLCGMHNQNDLPCGVHDLVE